MIGTILDRFNAINPGLKPNKLTKHCINTILVSIGLELQQQKMPDHDDTWMEADSP
ncbi:hypothetical protein SynA1560_01339 [Synechococcus sp. A15-60]|nr:hypothetical protein SynA1560_01339 [Synechococcus sp. A15-60]